ncbi:MAG: hypothetical protein GOV15_01385, partial [Candidatus Diapherotrites archaeon]|nr:hypothetical protein [Candidatus Diapherotrites archaeon]
MIQFLILFVGLLAGSSIFVIEKRLMKDTGFDFKSVLFWDFLLISLFLIPLVWFLGLGSGDLFSLNNVLLLLLL